MYTVYNVSQRTGRSRRLHIRGVLLRPVRLGQHGPVGRGVGISEITAEIFSLAQSGAVLVFRDRKHLSVLELEKLVVTVSTPDTPPTPEPSVTDVPVPSVPEPTPVSEGGTYTLEYLQAAPITELRELVKHRGLEVKLNLPKVQLAQEIFRLLGGQDETGS